MINLNKFTKNWISFSLIVAKIKGKIFSFVSLLFCHQEKRSTFATEKSSNTSIKSKEKKLHPAKQQLYSIQHRKMYKLGSPVRTVSSKSSTVADKKTQMALLTTIILTK